MAGSVTSRRGNVVLVSREGGFAFACLRCGYRDGKVMGGEYAAWGRFGTHVRVVHSGRLRRRRRPAVER